MRPSPLWGDTVNTILLASTNIPDVVDKPPIGRGRARTEPRVRVPVVLLMVFLFTRVVPPEPPEFPIVFVG